MKELIEYLARFIADSPDDVVVTEEEEDDRIIIRLEVAPDDKGKVIGREGRVAQAMRTLLRVGAAKRGVRGSPRDRIAALFTGFLHHGTRVPPGTRIPRPNYSRACH